jgi:hypothetical protein
LSSKRFNPGLLRLDWLTWQRDHRLPLSVLGWPMRADPIALASGRVLARQPRCSLRHAWRVATRVGTFAPSFDWVLVQAWKTPALLILDESIDDEFRFGIDEGVIIA